MWSALTTSILQFAITILLLLVLSVFAARNEGIATTGDSINERNLLEMTCSSDKVIVPIIAVELIFNIALCIF